jgi:hypothetical protein
MSRNSTTWELVNPEGAARRPSLSPAARPADLRTATIGLAWNGKPGGEEALEEIARLLNAQVDGLNFIKYWEVLPETVSPRELRRRPSARWRRRSPTRSSSRKPIEGPARRGECSASQFAVQTRWLACGMLRHVLSNVSPEGSPPGKNHASTTQMQAVRQFAPEASQSLPPDKRGAFARP